MKKKYINALKTPLIYQINEVDEASTPYPADGSSSILLLRLILAAQEPPQRPNGAGRRAGHAYSAPHGLIQGPHLAAGEPPTAEARAARARRGGVGGGGAEGAGEASGKRDGAAQPRARAGGGAHQLDRRRPGGRGAALLRGGGQAAASARGRPLLHLHPPLLPVQPRT